MRDLPELRGRNTPHSRPDAVAVVGLAGSGKSTAAAMLSDSLSCPVVYFGGAVLSEVARRGLPPDQASERLVRRHLRKEHGMAALAILNEQSIRDALRSSPLVVIDGLYSWSELDFLREQFDVAVIAIHASRRARHARMQARLERSLSAADLDARDRHEVTELDKAPPIVLADAHIVNEGTENELRAALQRALPTLGIDPVWDEANAPEPEVQR